MLIRVKSWSPTLNVVSHPTKTFPSRSTAATGCGVNCYLEVTIVCRKFFCGFGILCILLVLNFAISENVVII